MNVKNGILSEIYVENFKSIVKKLNDLKYLKVDPKFSARFGVVLCCAENFPTDCFWHYYLYERRQSGVMKKMNKGE